jgi:hypothetical protein
VLSLLSIFLVLGIGQFSGGYSRQQARSAAQSTQAALAWAQNSVLWRGGTHQVLVAGTSLTVSGPSGEDGETAGVSAPMSRVSSNVALWSTSEGIRLRFVGPFGSPDGGGSLYFGVDAPDYKVTVRPESGLSVRSVMPR